MTNEKCLALDARGRERGGDGEQRKSYYRCGNKISLDFIPRCSHFFTLPFLKIYYKNQKKKNALKL